MILSGLSLEEVKRLIKTEVTHEIKEILRGKPYYYDDDYGLVEQMSKSYCYIENII